MYSTVSCSRGLCLPSWKGNLHALTFYIKTKSKFSLFFLFLECTLGCRHLAVLTHHTQTDHTGALYASPSRWKCVFYTSTEGGNRNMHQRSGKISLFDLAAIATPTCRHQGSNQGRSGGNPVFCQLRS